MRSIIVTTIIAATFLSRLHLLVSGAGRGVAEMAVSGILGW